MLKDYFSFEGRIRRGVYGRRMLIVWGVLLLLIILLAALRADELLVIPVMIVFLWSVFSLMARRLHDMGHSAWWIVLCILALAIAIGAIGVTKGTVGPNKYGEDPLA